MLSKLKLRENQKHILTSISLSIILIVFLIVFFNYVHFFSGSSSDAIAILGILVQSSSALIAIVFAFLIFISQTVIGKYVSGTLDYIFNYRDFMLTFVFYAIATFTITLDVWLFSNFYWNPLVDVSIILFIIQISLLPVLFFVQSKLLSPKTIVATLLTKISLEDKETTEEATEKIKMVFSIVYKLAENREYDGAAYGLKAVTNIITSNPIKDEFMFYLWVIPNYERIGVECFKFDPNLSAFVNSQFFELVNHLKKSHASILVNVSSMITSSSSNIASAVTGKPYAENTLASSYRLLQEIYVSKSLVDYGFSAYDELIRMVQIIKMMEGSNVPIHSTVFMLQFDCKRLIDAGQHEMAEALISASLNAFPKNDYVLLEYVSIIFSAIPLNKKEIAEKLIEALKSKFGKLEIEFTKTSDPSRREMSVRNGVISVKAGSEEISEKIEWFKD